jgi:very-short-patch-repair endonuclease
MSKYCWEDIQKFYDQGHSLAEVRIKFGMSSATIFKAQKAQKFVARSAGAGVKIARAKNPNIGKMTDDIKTKISESMKVAHEEGRAWNIGKSRWNNEPSYPEKWFIQVIENEFDNKSYIREMPFGRFSLDFAWPDIKLCIEIDGEQHQRCEIQKARDIAKNVLLEQSGWKVLRMPWKEVCLNSKNWIEKAKSFIG